MTKEINSLEYTPVISDQWKEQNKIGNGGEGPVGGNQPISFMDKNPYHNQLSDTVNLKSATSSIVAAKINICMAVISSLYNHVSLYADNFPYTLKTLQHSYEFWSSMKDFVSSLNLSSDSIDKLYAKQQEAYNFVEERGNIVQTLQNYGTIIDDNRFKLQSRLSDIDSATKSLKLDIDSMQANLNMIADINRSTFDGASKSEYICSNLLGTITLDNDATNKLSSTLFDGISENDVKAIGNLITGGVTDRLETLKHVQDTSLQQSSVYRHFNNLTNLIDKKTNITPKIKHILRNVDNNTDFTNVMINDMFNKCNELDNQFNETLLNHIKYMHAENTILLKTFSDEAKINRFDTAYNVVKE